MDKTIPSPAPEEIPVMYGSANGFFDTDCINNPARANDDPAITALRALGSLRIFNIILSGSFAKIKVLIWKSLKTKFIPEFLYPTKTSM